MVFLLTDEGHIQDLLLATSSLITMCEGWSERVLNNVVDSWRQLCSLLVKSLSSKHGLDTASVQLTTPTETTEPSQVVHCS